MITMRSISRFIAEALDASVEFQALSTANAGETFSYFVNVDLSEVEVTIPYFGIVTFENTDEREVKHGFKTQILLGINRDQPTKVGNITEEATVEKIEALAIKALEIIADELRTYGINGDNNIKIAYTNFYVPNPEGEDDLQIQIDIELEQDKFLAC
ncbi:MAG: hypothetical protein U9O83_01625 [Campylobacterota bacterium]|nr:hypothetical protein [Campylobacterota bacterium]